MYNNANKRKGRRHCFIKNHHSKMADRTFCYYDIGRTLDSFRH